MTTKTSSLRMVSLVALSNEFEKIASSQPEAKKPTRGDKLKKWAKNTAIIGAGYGLGYGAGTLADKGLEKLLGNRWNNGWDVAKKRKYIGIATGLATAGAFISNQYLNKKRAEAAE